MAGVSGERSIGQRAWKWPFSCFCLRDVSSLERRYDVAQVHLEHRPTCCDSALIVDGSYNSHMFLSVRILDLTAIRKWMSSKHAYVNMWSHVPHCTSMRVSTEMRLLTRRASRDLSCGQVTCPLLNPDFQNLVNKAQWWWGCWASLQL